MSMSQEEIEALMSGLDIEDDSSDSDESSENIKVNTQEIEELLAQTEDYKNEDISKISKNDSKDIVSQKDESRVKTDEIEQLLNEIESESLDVEKNKKIEDSFKDLGLDSSLDINGKATQKKTSLPLGETSDIEYKKEISKEPVHTASKKSRSEDDIAKDWTSSRIEEGVFPFPAEKDTKVVNQLNEVANDSEEKVSQIFDVLSLALDNNNELRNSIKSMETFITSQANLLESLNNKFPNINIFAENLNNINTVLTSLNNLKLQINDEDAQFFQAMELMQFNDINRQKIERVMSVIRKLSMYLNNLFEDDGTSNNVAVAKHIHGDDSNDLIGDDLDKLIAEFSNNKE